MGIVFIIGGLIGIAIGIRGGEFYAGDADAISSFNQKVSSRSGRVVFILAGILLIAGGIKLFFFGS
jgi:hypothetical protein